jgi:di/tricarboxylate transporter
VDKDTWQGIGIVAIIFLLIGFVLPMTSAEALTNENPIVKLFSGLLAIGILWIVPAVRSATFLLIGLIGFGVLIGAYGDAEGWTYVAGGVLLAAAYLYFNSERD